MREFCPSYCYFWHRRRVSYFSKLHLRSFVFSISNVYALPKNGTTTTEITYVNEIRCWWCPLLNLCDCAWYLECSRDSTYRWRDSFRKIRRHVTEINATKAAPGENDFLRVHPQTYERRKKDTAGEMEFPRCEHLTSQLTGDWIFYQKNWSARHRKEWGRLLFMYFMRNL